MNEFENYTIRCCIGEVAFLQNKKKTRVAKDIAARIRGAAPSALDPGEIKKLDAEVNKFVNRQSLSAGQVEKIAPVALDLIYENLQKLLPRLEVQGPALATFVVEILQKYHPKGGDLVAGEPKNDIFENWKKCDVSTNDLASGVYQVFRRHKPVKSVTNPLDHILVTELVRIDTTARTCVLVDSDGLIHRGTIHINSNNLAFFLYQRNLGPNSNMQYRFYCLQLEGRTDIYSSLCIRIGDVTGRPIMSECFSIFVGRKKNPQLHEEFGAIAADEKITQLRSDSILLDYIAPAPKAVQIRDAPKQRPLQHVRDFPFFSKLITGESGTLTFFQEPIRAMDTVEIFDALQTLDLVIPEVFRHGISSAASEFAAAPEPSPKQTKNRAVDPFRR